MPSKGRRSAKRTTKRARRNDPSSVVRPGELTAAQLAHLTPAQRRRLDPKSVVRRGELKKK